KGAGTLKPRQLAVLENLLHWRDSEAQRRDCPHYKVFGNKELMEIARQLPKGLSQISGISPRLLDRYGKKIMPAIQAALNLPEAELPIYPRGERREKDPQAEKRFIRLKEWRTKIAAELELDPGVLINNTLLEALARRFPHTDEDLAEVALLKNWQRKVLGEGILRTLS
ncbi:MAG: HRDC domain-containing protein, partial [Desulfuromusa sp.]